MLTAKQKKEYLESDGGHCPHCHSEDIEGGHIEVESGSASQAISCNGCGTSWQDVYDLVAIIGETE